MFDKVSSKNVLFCSIYQFQILNKEQLTCIYSHGCNQPELGTKARQPWPEGVAEQSAVSLKRVDPHVK